MTSRLSRPVASPNDVGCRDRFDDDRGQGTVVGSTGPEGALRRGVDAEGLIAIDNGALRMQPLVRPGWGRQGIAYGPFRHESGLAMSVHVLNGHNSSQTFHHPETRRTMVRRVLSDASRGRFRRERHYENLAVGFVPEEVPADPLRRAHSFVMHAATADNGELWTAHGGRPARAANGILNVPFVFVVVLREHGAAYYTSSIPGATGAGQYPMMRPVGIDVDDHQGPFFAGVQQRILGEVGYRVDTRVYGVAVSTVAEWATWSGTAHAADRLRGSGPLAGREAETGQRWTTPPDVASLVAGEAGASPAEGGGEGSAEIVTGARFGLLHLVVEADRSGGALEIRWRHGLVLRIDERGQLGPRRGGRAG